MVKLRIASVDASVFSHLATATGGEVGLRKAPNRTAEIVQLIGSFDAQIVGVQGVDEELFQALRQAGWQACWTPRRYDEPGVRRADGCMMLYRRHMSAVDGKGSVIGGGLVWQWTLFHGGGTGLIVVNASIKCAATDAPEYEVVEWVTAFFNGFRYPVVVLSDYGSGMGGYMPQLFHEMRLSNAWGDSSIDLIVARDMTILPDTRVASVLGVPYSDAPIRHVGVAVDLGSGW